MMKLIPFAALVAIFALVGCEKSTVEGPAGKKLTLSKPADQTLKRGETNAVKVSISRSNFRDPVQVKFEGLPNGVTVQDLDRKINAEESSANFTLRAEPTADLVQNQEVKITVTGPDGLSVTESFKLTVKDKG
jgi:hypothetical protein